MSKETSTPHGQPHSRLDADITSASTTKGPIYPIAQRAIKSVLLLAIAVISACVMFFNPPDSTSNTRYLEDITVAMADNKANDAMADSAPKQTVVNGWVARDLLEIIAKENATMEQTIDQRPAQLLGLGILAIVVLGFDMRGVGTVLGIGSKTGNDNQQNNLASSNDLPAVPGEQTTPPPPPTP